MINIYLIIFILLVTIITHTILLFLRLKYKNFSKNEKLFEKEFSSNDIFSISNLTENNNKYKILLVEDDMANRKILKSQLKAAKYSVVTAENGQKALELIKTDSSICVILLDLILPDISGFDVCKKVRAEKTIYQLPIIMVTSKNRIKDLIDGFEAGANDFITKPYNIYELITRINSAISLKNIFDDNTTLKEINKIKSDIVDMAVHDLKSPLTIISGYSKRIIKNCEKDQVAFENSNKILASSNKMLTIIDKLLTDSKFQNHIMDFQSHNINKLVEESINFYIDLANNKNQKIDYKYDDSINTILIDKNAFNTIIENLLSNAIKYSPINSIISIKIYNTEYDVCISIKDSGNGFTKEEMDNMFTKYFPYTNKPTKGENSTGIGLYIIKDMVNKNGGKILLNSERGQGSEFIIKFPKS